MKKIDIFQKMCWFIDSFWVNHRSNDVIFHYFETMFQSSCSKCPPFASKHASILLYIDPFTRWKIPTVLTENPFDFWKNIDFLHFLLILQRFVLGATLGHFWPFLATFGHFWPIFFTECDWILKECLNIFQPSVNLFIYVEKCVHISIGNDDFEIIRYLANDGSMADAYCMR